MLFKIGDTANGQQTSEEIIEAEDYVAALQQMINSANLYCEGADEEAKANIAEISDYCRENNRLGLWKEPND